MEDNQQNSFGFSDTTSTRKVFGLKKRIRAVAGGCLGKGTLVRMFDLSLKKVEDIRVGDCLLGVDGKPRNVLTLCRGESSMYRVEQKKGISYTVNNEHLLVLEDQGTDKRKTVNGKRIYIGRDHKKGFHKIRADDFYNESCKSTERRFKGIKVGVNFDKQEVSLDPYYLGLWLGDGTSRNAYITNVDKEVLDYLYNEVPDIYDVSVYRLDKVTTAIVKRKGKYNDIVQRLKKLDLIKNKHIPIQYIKNDRETRLRLLAGLIDSDGCLTRDSKSKRPKGYSIVQKNERLAKDILLLVRSLGYYSNIRTRISRMNRTDGSIYKCRTYSISFTMQDYSELPVKIERKFFNYKNDKRNCLRSSIRLEKLAKDKYYGFELDGDHLFLLEDFTVTHNTSASKTISILVWLIDYCQVRHTRAKLCTVGSESYPHLEKGAMLDFENIMKDRGYWNEDRWNKTKHTYTFETGNKLEFSSFDTYGKAHGPRRDVLFINEANNVPYNIADQLITRTREIVWLDWNPSEEFWFYTEMLPNRTDIDFITLTYLDNEALDPVTVSEIESHKNNRAWWQVYGLGQLGEVETRIYRGWQVIDDIPHHARLYRRGLDFGYSSDPTAIVDIYEYNGGYILDEVCYQKGLSNKRIADILKDLEYPSTVVKADSAEPKSIDEIKSYGINILPAQKGPGSLSQGIQYVQDQKISVTKRSLNLLKEYRSYLWEVDKNGKILTEPVDDFNHMMDAIRYGFDGSRKKFVQKTSFGGAGWR